MATSVSSAAVCQPGLLGRQQRTGLTSVRKSSSSSLSFTLSSNASTVKGGQRISLPLLGYINLRQEQQCRNGVVCSASSNICWQDACVSKEQRRKLLRQKGCIVWLTGLSGSGKSTVAFTVDKILTSMGKVCYVLDGDNLRHGLCKNLGFSAADRAENMRRVGETAKLFVDAGLITCVSLISPYTRDRDGVRDVVKREEFIEVYMDVPLEVCERRDCKGLYKLARAGVIKGFTGIDDPYEAPVNPEIKLSDTNEKGVEISADEMAWTVVNYLSDNGYLSS
jgi:adenylylsulfate kinase